MLELWTRSGALAIASMGLLLTGVHAAAPPERPELATAEDRLSYAMGARLGRDVRSSGHELDRALVLRGMEDGLAGAVALTDAEIEAALREGVAQQRARQEALRAERAQSALEQGRAFLAENRARPGVVELPNGLQYEVLQEGNGRVPTVEDNVVCHYRAALLDGTVFDETYTPKGPRTFPVTSVVDGLEQALLRMRTGARWKVYVPPELGYGARGAGKTIPPNATLVFEVELLEIAPIPGT